MTKPMKEQIFEAFASLNYNWNDQVNIIGIQSDDGSVTDEYDDLIGLVSNSGLWLWSGTTDPGRYYTDKPMVDGCAHLLPGQYKNAYTFGKHYNQFALVQCGPFKIWRDIDRSGTNTDGDRYTEGLYGMNLHAGEGQKIGQWSAGCQVIKGLKEHSEFMKKLIDMAKGKQIFDYTLLTQREIYG